MIDLRVTQQAADDLESIAQYGIARFGAASAERHLQELDRVLTRICDFPELGRERSELGEGLRSMSHRPHVILYRLAGSEIVVVRVIHSARDIRAVLADR